MINFLHFSNLALRDASLFITDLVSHPASVAPRRMSFASFGSSSRIMLESMCLSGFLLLLQDSSVVQNVI